MNSELKPLTAVWQRTVAISPPFVVWVRWLMVPFFAVCLWVNAVSDWKTATLKHPCPLTPAKEAFIMWPLIYLLVFLFILRELIQPCKTLPQPERLYALVIISCVFNSLYLESFMHNRLVISEVFHVSLWITIATAYWKVYHDVRFPFPFALFTSFSDPHHQSLYPCNTLVDYAFIRLPFTIYFAWVCGATSLNSVIVAQETLGLRTDNLYVLVGLFAFLGLPHVLALLWARDLAFVLVGAWALAWIGVQAHRDKVKLSRQDIDQYAIRTAIEGMAILEIVLVVAVIIAVVVRAYWQRIMGLTHTEDTHPPATAAAVRTSAYGSVQA